MKNYSESLVIIPCHSMEDFPTHYRGHDAKNLLACWTSVWHPALIAGTGKQPRWMTANDVRLETENGLVVVPVVAEHVLDETFEADAKRNNITVISGDLDRDGIIRTAIAQSSEAQQATENIPGEFVKDCLALGYAYLQIQIMTRQLRYSSNLDESTFAEQLVSAATQANQGLHEQATQSLTACFDLLLEEKNSYYPVQPDLIDLALTASTTLGSSLTKQLDSDHITNLLLTGENARVLEANHPSAIDRIKLLVESERLSIAGGLETELPDPLVASDSVIRSLAQGRQSLKKILGVEPTVFARRKFGLTPSLPGLLDQFNYIGAIHATLDDGTFPKGSSSNIRWTGNDGQSILAFGDYPLRADEPGALLGLGLQIGEQIDSAHVATILFAHWPDRTCDSFQDLIRISAYGPLLGQFIRLEDYFDSIYDPGYGDTFSVDEYRSPYLKQAVANGELNPVSRYADYWTMYYRLSTCRAWLAQIATVSSFHSQPLPAATSVEKIELSIRKLETRLDQLIFDRQCEGALSLETEVSGIEDQLAQTAAVVPNSENKPATAHRMINATSATKRVVECFPETFGAPVQSTDGPLLFADSGKDQTDWIVEIPPMGNVRVANEGTLAKDPFDSVPRVVEGNVLRNEFFELQVDETTGGIRSILQYGDKNNLLSQRLALRMPSQSSGPDSKSRHRSPARYTEMVVDEIRNTATSRIRGEINTRGRLVDENNDVASFEQTLRVTRGIPRIEIEIKVHPGIELTGSVNHYFCNRLAWKDETSEVICNAQETRMHVTSDWFLATNFVEIQQHDQRVTLLTGGHPFHRRSSRRMLDSLLIVGRELARDFKMAIDIGQRYPLMAANQWLTRTPSVPVAPGNDLQATDGWLFHFSCKNILATWWKPILDDHSRVTGMQIRLRETEGRNGTLNIRCPREIATADRVNFLGDFIRTVELNDDQRDRVPIEFVANDYFQISIHWKL